MSYYFIEYIVISCNTMLCNMLLSKIMLYNVRCKVTGYVEDCSVLCCRCIQKPLLCSATAVGET